MGETQYIKMNEVEGGWKWNLVLTWVDGAMMFAHLTRFAHKLLRESQGKVFFVVIFQNKDRVNDDATKEKRWPFRLQKVLEGQKRVHKKSANRFLAHSRSPNLSFVRDVDGGRSWNFWKHMFTQKNNFQTH